MKRILCFLLIMILFSGFAGAQQKGQPLSGKKIVMVVASKNFKEIELLEPEVILFSKGAKVVIASSSLDSAVGTEGAKIKPEILLKDIKPKDWDAIVFVGGPGAKQYWDDKVAHNILIEAFKQNKVIGAICIAPVTLANAGILKDKRATVSEEVAAKLTSKGAKYIKIDVQRDGRIITASGPKAVEKFAEAIAKALEVK